MKQLLTLVLIFSFSSAFSQNAKIDSLQQQVNKAKGTDKIIQLHELAHAYWTVDLKKSISLCNQALRLGERLKYNKEKALSYNIISGAYCLLNNLATADTYCDSSLVVSKKYGPSDIRMKALSNKILIYSLGYTSPNFRISTYLDDLLELCHKKGDYDIFAEAIRNILTKNLTEKELNNINILEYLESKEKKADDKLKPVLYMLYSTYYNSKNEFFKSIEILKKTLTITKDKFVRINCCELSSV